MTPVRSILVLATVVTAVLAPLFVGHALSNHESIWFILGGVMLATSAMLGLLSTRGARHEGDHAGR